MARLPRLTPAELDTESRALYDAIIGGPRASSAQVFRTVADDGSLYGPFNAMLYAPPVGDALQQLGAAVRYRTQLSDRERELAILLVAAHHASRFETYAHTALARRAGFDEGELRALNSAALPPTLRGRETATGEFVLAALNAGDVGDDLYQRARAELGERGLVELVTLIGYYAALALQMRIFRAEELPESAEDGTTRAGNEPPAPG